MNNRIGVDIGGTFTDFVMYDEKTSKIIISKIPTTPKNPEQGTIEIVSGYETIDSKIKSDFKQ